MVGALKRRFACLLPRRSNPSCAWPRCAAGARKWVVNLRVLLLHNTQHDLPAVESVLTAQGYVVEQICVNSQFRERPILVFTKDDDPVAMRAAIQARMSAYVVAGMQPKRCCVGAA